RRVFDHHLGQSNDGVERRAQLVADAGDELRLVFARQLQLAVSRSSIALLCRAVRHRASTVQPARSDGPAVFALPGNRILGPLGRLESGLDGTPAGRGPSWFPALHELGCAARAPGAPGGALYVAAARQQSPS